MKIKLDKQILANSFALATAILWVLCTLLVWLWPDFTWRVTEWWMHGMDLTAMGGWNLTLNNFLLGGLTLVASAWVTGYTFGWSWEITSRKK